MKIEIDDLVHSLGSCNQGVLSIIQRLGAQYQAKTEIPELLARWCEFVFLKGSNTFRYRTCRELRKAGWSVDKVKVPCGMCGGTGRRLHGFKCHTCNGKGSYFTYSIPATVRRRSITL